MQKLRNRKTTTVVETTDEYCGHPMVIELDPATGKVFAWPKGKREKVQISLVGAWQSAIQRRNPIPAKAMGMSKRVFKKDKV